jgi:DNA processing protein
MEQYGCLLSEFTPGTPPMGFNFPKRNRIISGLSCGVLVVEAPEKSGALITAQLALDQGRDVFVVPGNIDVDTFVGSNRLLRDGAIMVSHGWDIMSEYEAQYPDKIRKFTEASRQQVYPDEMQKAAEPVKTPRKQSRRADAEAKNREKIEKQEKIVIDKRETSPYIDLNDILPKLSEDEGKIVCTLESGELLVDDVIARCGLPAGKVLALLTLLEVKGIVQRLPGRRICLKKTGK